MAMPLLTASSNIIPVIQPIISGFEKVCVSLSMLLCLDFHWEIQLQMPFENIA